MSRERIENIIIGTLLESTEDENYFQDCRCCITEDMFADAVNMRIYHLISEMNANGQYDTCPSSIFATYGDSVMDILDDMLDKVNNYSFVYLKWEYNEKQYVRYQAMGMKPAYTGVRFSDYVNAFIKMVFYYEAKRNKTA